MNELQPSASTTSPEAQPGNPAPGRRRQPDRQLGDRVKSLSLSRLPERRNTIGTSLTWLGALAIVAVAGWYGYTKFLSAKASQQETAASRSSTSVSENKSPPVPAVAERRVETPRVVAPSLPTSSPSPAPAKGEVILEAKGYIVPAHQILVSPKVSGMIMTLGIEEGRRVNKGEVLAVLESTDYEADVARTKANVRLMRERLRELENGNRPEEIKEAEAELRENEAQLVQLESDYKRTEELRKRNSVTLQEFELALSKYVAQQQRVARMKLAHELMKLGPRVERIDIAKAELAQAEADVIKAEWRLGNCTIRAPISGTILKKNAEEGNIVNPVAFNGSFSLCEMADLADLEVDLNIQERDISVIQVGQTCRVRAEAYPDRIYHGVVDRLMPIADRAKGAIPVRVKLRIPAEEEGVYLKPEMGAIVTFLSGKASSATAFAAPKEALESTATEPTSVSTSP